MPFYTNYRLTHVTRSWSSPFFYRIARWGLLSFLFFFSRHFAPRIPSRFSSLNSARRPDLSFSPPAAQTSLIQRFTPFFFLPPLASLSFPQLLKNVVRASLTFPRPATGHDGVFRFRSWSKSTMKLIFLSQLSLHGQASPHTRLPHLPVRTANPFAYEDQAIHAPRAVSPFRFPPDQHADWDLFRRETPFI